MCDHTQWIIIHGLEELPHACDTCIYLFTMPDGTILKTEVITTDGIMISRCQRWDFLLSLPSMGRGRRFLKGEVASFWNSESGALSQWDFGFRLCAAPEFQV